MIDITFTSRIVWRSFFMEEITHQRGVIYGEAQRLCSIEGPDRYLNIDVGNYGFLIIWSQPRIKPFEVKPIDV